MRCSVVGSGERVFAIHNIKMNAATNSLEADAPRISTEEGGSSFVTKPTYEQQRTTPVTKSEDPA
jgi:hypothetical protein